MVQAQPVTPSQPSTRNQILGLAAFLLACYGVSAIGAAFTAPQIAGWYAGLVKPAYNPPNWVFAPVWTVLYGMMAVAAWLIWKRPGSPLRTLSLFVFWCQLVLNFLWTPVFFSFHLVLAAYLILLVLWFVIAVTLLLFWQQSRLAGALLAPYLFWVSFASLLNYGVWRLNS